MIFWFDKLTLNNPFTIRPAYVCPVSLRCPQKEPGRSLQRSRSRQQTDQMEVNRHAQVSWKVEEDVRVGELSMQTRTWLYIRLKAKQNWRKNCKEIKNHQMIEINRKKINLNAALLKIVLLKRGVKMKYILKTSVLMRVRQFIHYKSE